MTVSGLLSRWKLESTPSRTQHSRERHNPVTDVAEQSSGTASARGRQHGGVDNVKLRSLCAEVDAPSEDYDGKNG